jgi:hypothetical protein
VCPKKAGSFGVVRQHVLGLFVVVPLGFKQSPQCVPKRQAIRIRLFRCCALKRGIVLLGSEGFSYAGLVIGV